MFGQCIVNFSDAGIDIRNNSLERSDTAVNSVTGCIVSCITKLTSEIGDFSFKSFPCGLKSFHPFLQTGNLCIHSVRHTLKLSVKVGIVVLLRVFTRNDRSDGHCKQQCHQKHINNLLFHLTFCF